ncbi:MAG TPA: glycosyltransferase [Thermoanaerobaculia bacterium]|nr:glycosyltransferase [Thermoanaerobaculia bacterium]
MRIGLDLATALVDEQAPSLAVVELLAEMMRHAGDEDEVVVFVPDEAGPIAWRVRDQKLHQVETPFGGGRSAELWRALSFPAVERLSPGRNGPRLGALDVCHSLEPPLMPSRARRRMVTISSVNGLPSPVRRSLRRADDVLVTSEILRSSLLHQVTSMRGSKLDQLGAKLQVVHPGVHPRFAESPKPGVIETLCARHPFLEQPYILAVGLPGLDGAGTRCVLEAWMLTRNAWPTLPKLVLALSAQPPKEAVEAFYQTAPEGEREPAVIELPDANLLPALYRGAEMVLHPAQDHRFGRRVAEAAAAGVVAVVGSGCGVLEVLGDGPIRIDDLDPAAWAHAIETLHSLPEERRRRTEHARKPAQALTWSATAAQLWDVYRDAASRPAA